MLDQIICLIAGAFIGSFITMVAISLAVVSRKADDDCRTDESGVDEVLDELFETVKNQPKPYHDEERQEDFKRKYPQE